MLTQKFFRFLQNEFSLRERVLLAIIGLCIPVILIGLFLYWITGPEEIGELILTGAESIAELAGLFFFLFNSTIMQTTYWRYMVGSMLVIAAAFIFMILHLPGGIELLLAGCILLEIIYTIRFVRQNHTPLSGWFKYGWVCSWIVTSLGILLHIISESWGTLPVFMFWITLIIFLREKWVIAVKYNGLA